MKQTPWIAFSIDRDSPKPVFEQICAAIRQKAASGELQAGARMPPTRAFATELGVSRSTMVTAYEQLVAEGYLESRPGSGYTICPLSVVEFGGRPATERYDEARERAASPRPFRAGQPDMRLFPLTQWAKTVSRLCRTNPEAMLVGGSLFGNPDLRKAVADHISEWRGIEASPHQVIITAGSIDALEICLRSLTKPGDGIGIEDPGYPPFRSFASALGLRPTFMKIDRGGASVPNRSSKAKLVILTPSHQYPLGGAMTPQRRLEFILWTQERDGWIVEDDYDSEFRYAGRPIPAMAGFDKLSRTIYVGSFSKIFSNSLRLGYVVVPDRLIESFAGTLNRFGVKASYLPQQALAAFIEQGEFYRHLRRMRRIYAERRKFLLGRLAGDFRRFGSFVDHQAGMQVAFHLSGKAIDREIVERATAEGLEIEALSSFCGTGTSTNGLLLGYCGFTQDEMAQALEDLRYILEACG